MAIRRMISRDPGEFREFQRRMTTVGKIRLGIYETPPGQRGRPKKIDTFRFTSENEALIRAVADAYGGEARPWTPQGSKTAEWEVISAADAIPVYIVNGQDLDPWYEAWAGGRTCIRRCDGIVNKITQELCVCIPADGTASKLAAKDQCKPTTRAQVMLAEIQGLGSWMLESHGENAARGLSVFREFIAAAPMPVPAMLRLQHQTRRQWNFEKKKFDSLDFYVPVFDISAITTEQIAIGGDALTQALAAAGAPAIGGSAQMAIEARPVSAPVVQPVVPTPRVPFDIEGMRPRILQDIEACTTVEALNGIRDKLIERGVTDSQVKDAWASKMNAVVAAAKMERPYRVLVTGSRTWTDVIKLSEQLDIAWMTHKNRMVLVHGKCEKGADLQAAAWAKARGVPVQEYPADWSQGRGAGFARNQAMVDSRPDIVLSFNRMQSKGTEHCTAAAEAAGLKVLRFTDDTPVEPEVPKTQPVGIENRQTDRRPCFDPWCANDPATACGFTPNQHMEAHGAMAVLDMERVSAHDAGRISSAPPTAYGDLAVINEARAGIGLEPIRPVDAFPGEEREYQVGDTVTVGGIEFTKVREMPSVEDMRFEAQQEEMLNPDPGPVDENGCFTLPDGSCVSPGPCIHTPVDGTIETTGPVLPDVPAGDYDADEVYASIMTGASRQAPPLTTAEVNGLIRNTFKAIPEVVSGHDLARLRAGLKSGAVSWR